MDTVNAEASSSRLPSGSHKSKKRSSHDDASRNGKRVKVKHLASSLDRIGMNGPERHGEKEHRRSREERRKDKRKHRKDRSGHVDGAGDRQLNRDKERRMEKKERKSSPFEHCLSRMRLSVPPKYAGDWLNGVREVLDGMLMRYVPQMSGVLLAHWEHEFMDDTVKIINESPFGVCDVQFRSVIWAPRTGQRLTGSHSLSSPSHIALLFGKTFNISIPLQHIPQDQYVFVATDENDPLARDEEDDSDSEVETVGLGAFGAVEEVGRWRNTKTGKMLGEGGKPVKFTVIGMQVNNQVLSLTGSLLADPTNPPPPPPTTTQIRAISPSPSASPEPQSKVVRIEKEVSHRQRENGVSDTRTAEAIEVPEGESVQIDERFLSQRELKKRRKDEEKRRREERKARKEERVLEKVVEAGDEDMVRMSGVVEESMSAPPRKSRKQGEGKKSKSKS